MGAWSRGRRVEHARYVGLRTLPEPRRPSLGRRIADLPRRYDRAIEPRVTAVAALAAAGVVGLVVLAGTLSGGGLLPAAADVDPSPSSIAASLPAVAVVPSSAPAASPTTTPAPSASAPGLPTGYRWPLDHGRITTAFAPSVGGQFLVAGVPFHDGLDIASFCGDHVLAAHGGVVLASGRHVEDALGWVGDIAGYKAHLTAKHLWGSQAVMVIVDDGNGYRSVYIHLYQSLVKVGQRVGAGQLLGWEGRTGDATGCHLHYSIFRPTETERFITDPNLVRKYDLPAAEVARLDPLTVLPPMSTTDLTWGWGAEPSASP